MTKKNKKNVRKALCRLARENRQNQRGQLAGVNGQERERLTFRNQKGSRNWKKEKMCCPI